MIPAAVEAHLRRRYASYQHHVHPAARSAQALAAAEHASGHRVAKVVVLRLDGELAIAVVAATDRVDVRPLEEATGARAELARERDFAHRFLPCELGAEPPLALFGVPIYVDDKLIRERTLVFPAGSHVDSAVLDTGEWAWCERVRAIANLGRRAEPETGASAKRRLRPRSRPPGA